GLKSDPRAGGNSPPPRRASPVTPSRGHTFGPAKPDPGCCWTRHFALERWRAFDVSQCARPGLSDNRRYSLRSRSSHAMNSPSPRPGVSPWWRIASVVLMIALMLAWATSASMFEQLKSQISHLQGRLDQTSQVRFVSVLQDSQGQPAMLITHDPQQG